eukprot:8356164-Alexandrium_andersonii.AAC.1
MCIRDRSRSRHPLPHSPPDPPTRGGPSEEGNGGPSAAIRAAFMHQPALQRRCGHMNVKSPTAPNYSKFYLA